MLGNLLYAGIKRFLKDILFTMQYVKTLSSGLIE